MGVGWGGGWEQEDTSKSTVVSFFCRRMFIIIRVPSLTQLLHTTHIYNSIMEI